MWTAKNSHKICVQNTTINNPALQNFRCLVGLIVCYTAGFSVVTQRSSPWPLSGAQGCNVKSVIPKIKHCKLKRLEKTWARVSSGMFSSNQLRIYVGKWRVGYNYLIQTRYKIFYSHSRQDELTALMRKVNRSLPGLWSRFFCFWESKMPK